MIDVSGYTSELMLLCNIVTFVCMLVFMYLALTAYRGYRMVEEECLGMECPCCKVRKAEDIARMMSAYGRRPE